MAQGSDSSKAELNRHRKVCVGEMESCKEEQESSYMMFHCPQNQNYVWEQGLKAADGTEYGVVAEPHGCL